MWNFQKIIFFAKLFKSGQLFCVDNQLVQGRRILGMERRRVAPQKGGSDPMVRHPGDGGAGMIGEGMISAYLERRVPAPNWFRRCVRAQLLLELSQKTISKEQRIPLMAIGLMVLFWGSLFWPLFLDTTTPSTGSARIMVAGGILATLPPLVKLVPCAWKMTRDQFALRPATRPRLRSGPAMSAWLLPPYRVPCSLAPDRRMIAQHLS